MNPGFSHTDRADAPARWWVAILCLVQPILDALSHWMGPLPHGGTITLGLRMLLLLGTVALAYLLSENKKAYWLTALALTLYWLCHALACVRVGYRSPMEDFINFSRVAQIPVLTLCLITLLRRIDEPVRLLETVLTATLYLIAAITLIALVTKTTVWSYVRWKVGLSGWFDLPNSQSAIYGVLTAVTVFAALARGDWLHASIRCCVGDILLYHLGTRLAYAEIFGIAAAAVIAMLLTRRFDRRAAAALLLLAAVCAVFYGRSPMAANQRLYAESVAEQQAAADSANETQPLDALYETYLSAMVDRFGMEAVKEVYHESRDIAVIGDVRLYKINYCRMVMQSLPATSRLFGFELAQTRHQNSIFDVENDFHGIYFLFGVCGLVLLISYLLYFAVRALLGMLQRPADCLTMWVLGFGLAAVILIGNAYFSASVLRRPNASFYLSLALAALWLLTERREERLT